MDKLIKALTDLEDTTRAKVIARYLDTKMQIEDSFLGIRAPQIHTIVDSSPPLSLDEIHVLLSHTYHEIRLAALLLLVKQFKKGTKKDKELIFTFYLNL